MSFSRHNIEKRRLIELVRLNPILWDCRLPHYKRSDKKKAVKWNELGRIFSVSGERVQRTFTSLREIFRRELNHEKLLGNRFKSKWEFYDAMAFLREVIRERKSRDRAKTQELRHQHQLQQQQQQQQSNGNVTNNNNNNCSNVYNNNNKNFGIDEYQYFAPNDPNNPNNQMPQPPLLTTPIQTTAPTLAPTSAPQPLQQQQPQLQTLQLQPDVVLSLNTGALAALKQFPSNSGGQYCGQPLKLQEHAQLLPTPHSPHGVSTIHSRSSSSPSIYIKDERDTPDDTISLASTPNGKLKSPSPLTRHSGFKLGNGQLNTRYFSASQAPLPALRRRLPSPGVNLIIDEDEMDELDGDLELDADLDDGDPDVELLGDGGRLSVGSGRTMPKVRRPTAREQLYVKFGEFVAARLNTLHETVANELMNKILLLIAEK